MARCFSKITKTQWFSPSYIMSRTYQHDLRHWTPNTMNTCEFSITWRLHTKIEFTHQILCIKIKIPTLKEKIPHAEKLSRAEFGTFSSLLSVKKNCVTVNFLIISILNRAFGVRSESSKSPNNAENSVPHDDLKRSQKPYHLVNFLAEKNACKPRISSVVTSCR